MWMDSGPWADSKRGMDRRPGTDLGLKASSEVVGAGDHTIHIVKCYMHTF